MASHKLELKIIIEHVSKIQCNDIPPIPHITQIMNKTQNPMFTNHKNMYFQDLHPTIDPAKFKRKKQQPKTSNLHHQTTRDLYPTNDQA